MNKKIRKENIKFAIDELSDLMLEDKYKEIHDNLEKVKLTLAMELDYI